MTKTDRSTEQVTHDALNAIAAQVKVIRDAVCPDPVGHPPFSATDPVTPAQIASRNDEAVHRVRNIVMRHTVTTDTEGLYRECCAAIGIDPVTHLSVHPLSPAMPSLPALLDEVERLEADNARLRALLKRMEWGCEDGGCDLGPMCFFCRAYEEDGHAPDCALGKELEARR